MRKTKPRLPKEDDLPFV